MDHHRVSDLTVHRLRRTRSRAAIAALLGIAIAACLPPSASAPPTSTESAAATGTGEPSGAPRETPVATRSPASSPPEVDLATVTQLCDEWELEVSAALVSCPEGIGFALEVAPPDRRITKIRFEYGRCEAASCPVAAPNHAWVVYAAAAGDFDIVVEIFKAADGTKTTGLVSTASTPDDPPFDAPPVKRPAIEGAPASIALRDAYPYCGVSTGDESAADFAARRCCLDGVLGGSPVELTIEAHGTEGARVNGLYRFSGTGPIVVYEQEAGEWRATAIGLGLISTPSAFIPDGISIPLPTP